jgi:predicted ATP-grasp superfamily ATP-dependent carboligase
MSVFVTDGNLRSTLAVVRSLGRAGITVGVGDTRRESLAGGSKYCRESLAYPSPLHEPLGFQQFLLKELVPHGYRFLLATSDLTVQLVAPLRQALAPRVCLLVEDEARLRLVQDKAALLCLAQSQDVDVPRFVCTSVREQILHFAASAGYPVVIKPRCSRLWIDGQWRNGSVQYAHTPRELLDRWEESHRSIPLPMVQERIEGEGRGVFLCMWNGEVKAAFCHRRLREKPPWGGVSVLSESIAPEKDIVDRSARLLRAAGWSGPAMVEYKMDVRDGKPKLMEINARYWGSLQLAIASGADFPLLHYRLAQGEDPPAQMDYRTGVRCRWLLGDLDSLLTRLRLPEKKRCLLRDTESRLRACAEFLCFRGRDLRYDVFSADDSRPGWLECEQYLRENMSILWRKVAPGKKKPA